MADEDELNVAVLQEKFKNLEALIKATVTKLEELEKDRDSAFKWGIMLLGTAVISLGTWVFNHIVFVDKAIHP